MKKIMVIVFILTFIFLTGCLDYKAYNLPKEDDNSQELNLDAEIAAIEKELESMDNNTVKEKPVEKIEEIILPDPEKKSQTKELSILTVKENELVRLKVKTEDPDNDRVTYTFSKPLNQDGTWQTHYSDAGEYIVTITATDGQLTTEEKIKLIVERVNIAPVIGSVSNMNVKEGDVVKFEPDVTDPNNDQISVTVSEPLSNGEFTTDHTSAGEYQIKITATDGEKTTEKSFTLTVADVNVPPKVTNLKDITVKEGEIVKIEPVVSDLDNDDLTITISEPVGDDGIWNTKFTDHGEYVITVIVNDGKDKIENKVKVTVEDVNMPPKIVDVSLNTE